MKNSPEYLAIQAHYGERTAARSGVRLIQHIDEGLEIMARIGASESAQKAYCLHPLFQNDADLTTVGLDTLRRFSGVFDPLAVLLTLEYRHTANAFLSGAIVAENRDWGDSRGGLRILSTAQDIKLSGLKDVNDMLIADKVQNRKDFLRYHLATHENSARLDAYFKLWLERLGITDARYAELIEGL